MNENAIFLLILGAESRTYYGKYDPGFVMVNIAGETPLYVMNSLQDTRIWGGIADIGPNKILT